MAAPSVPLMVKLKASHQNLVRRPVGLRCQKDPSLEDIVAAYAYRDVLKVVAPRSFPCGDRLRISLPWPKLCPQLRPPEAFGPAPHRSPGKPFPTGVPS